MRNLVIYTPITPINTETYEYAKEDMQILKVQYGTINPEMNICEKCWNIILSERKSKLKRVHITKLFREQKSGEDCERL